MRKIKIFVYDSGMSSGLVNLSYIAPNESFKGGGGIDVAWLDHNCLGFIELQPIKPAQGGE